MKISSAYCLSIETRDCSYVRIFVLEFVCAFAGNATYSAMFENLRAYTIYNASVRARSMGATFGEVDGLSSFQSQRTFSACMPGWLLHGLPMISAQQLHDSGLAGLAGLGLVWVGVELEKTS